MGNVSLKVLERSLNLILITIVWSFTNSLSRTSLYFSLKTSFVYSNLFSLAKTLAKTLSLNFLFKKGYEP